MTGLKSIVIGTGNDFSQAQKFIEGFTQDGLVPASDAATALKNLLSRGFGMGEASDILNRLKDSAAFGRQASLSLGEAIKGATEGIKNENSVLVDNAGVTKNVSKMWEDYAKTIGKSANELTVAEKRQAEYAGIMEETRFQVGDAAKYSQQFAGAQARLSAETLKLQQAFGSALVPSLNTLLSIITPIIAAFADFMNSNKELAAVIAIAAVTFAGLITGITAVGSALRVLTPALAALNTTFLALLANPVILTFTAIAAAATLIAVNVQKAKQSQQEYNSALDSFNKVRREGITKAEVPQIQAEIVEREKVIQQYDALMGKYNQLKAAASDMTPPLTILDQAEKETGISAEKLSEAFNKLGIKIDFFKGNASEARKQVETLKNAIKEAEKITSSEANEQAKSLAQRRAAIVETQNLIRVYQSAKQGSSDWTEAQKKLAEQFPQFSTASGIMIDAIKKTIDAQNDAVNTEWRNLQAKITIRKSDLNSVIRTEQAKINVIKTSIAALDDEGDSARRSVKLMMVAETTAKLNELKGELSSLDSLSKVDLNKVVGVMPTGSTTDYKASAAAYENAALESALKIHDHRVRMSEISKAEELADLEEINRKYVQTADERMDLEERIYSAKKELEEKANDDAEKAIQQDEDRLRKRTENSIMWIEEQKMKNNPDNPTFTAEDEVAAYNRIIKYHKEYLDKLLADKKQLSEEEQKIRDEEEQKIREWTNKIFTINKEAAEQQKQDAVDSINNLTNNIIEALRQKYQEKSKIEKAALDENRKSLENWRKDQLKAIDDVYKARIKAIDNQIKAIERQQEAEERSKVNSDEQIRINSLQDRINRTGDVVERFSLEMELQKLLAERTERLQKQQVDDQIAALRDKKDTLEDEKQIQIDAIDSIYEKDMDSLQDRLDAWDKFYFDEKTGVLAKANLEATAEKLLMQKNQDDIIILLGKYGESYNLTGITLGQRLYEGVKSWTDKIPDLVSSALSQLKSVQDEVNKTKTEVSKATSKTSSSNTTITVNNVNVKSDDMRKAADVVKVFEGIGMAVSKGVPG
jgi:hypothetical protein